MANEVVNPCKEESMSRKRTIALASLLALGLLGCGEAGGGSFHYITQQEPL